MFRMPTKSSRIKTSNERLPPVNKDVMVDAYAYQDVEASRASEKDLAPFDSKTAEHNQKTQERLRSLECSKNKEKKIMISENNAQSEINAPCRPRGKSAAMALYAYGFVSSNEFEKTLRASSKELAI